MWWLGRHRERRRFRGSEEPLDDVAHFFDYVFGVYRFARYFRWPTSVHRMQF